MLEMRQTMYDVSKYPEFAQYFKNFTFSFALPTKEELEDYLLNNNKFNGEIKFHDVVTHQSFQDLQDRIVRLILFVLI